LTQRNLHIDFFLVGAAKSGTSIISEWLKAHPSIFIPQIKETNFFSTDIEVNDFSSAYKQNTFLDLESYFKDEDLRPLHISFVRQKSHMEKLYEMAPPGTINGECSTSHLYSLSAANNIYQHNAQAKIIMILRNPVERAYSHYLMARKYGFTNLSFREAVERDISARKKGWGINELYVDLGLYSKQIQRYKDLFPGGQIRIMKYEELQDDPQRCFDTICLFLGVPTMSIPKLERANQASMARMDQLNLWLTQSGLKKDIGKIIPGKLKEKLKKIYYTDVNLPSLTQEDRSYMQDLFEEDIKRTSRITGLDLDTLLK